MNRVSAPLTDTRVSFVPLFEAIVLGLALFFVFTIPWENAIRIPGIGTISRAIGLPLIVGWLLLQLSSQRLRHVRPFHVWAFAFVFWSAVSQLWSIDTDLSFVQTKTFIQLFLSMVILWSMLDTPQRARWAMQAYVFGALVVTLFVFYNYAQGNVTRWTRRASITGVDENDIALVLAIALPMALYLTLAAGSGWRQWQGRILNLAFIPAALVAIVMTGSRGGVSATLPFVLFALYAGWRGRSRGLLSLTVLVPLTALVVLTFAPEEPLERITTTFDELSTGGISGRATIWTEGFDRWLNGGLHSLFGLGSGGYVWSIGRAAHSTPLSILVEGGMIGFALFIGTIGALIVEARNAIPPVRALCLAVLCAWGIGASALSWEYRKPTWVVWSLVLCIAVSHPRRLDESSAPSANGDVELQRT